MARQPAGPIRRVVGLLGLRWAAVGEHARRVRSAGYETDTPTQGRDRIGSSMSALGFIDLPAQPARPARRISRLAGVTTGGTGRYNLVVGNADDSISIVVYGISKSKADHAADTINAALQSWVDRLTDEHEAAEQRRRTRRTEPKSRT